MCTRSSGGPRLAYLFPFAGWSSKSPQWYADHHDVKHNRQARFPAANLSNVVSATCGLFAVLVKVDRNAFSPHSYAHGVKNCTFKSGHFFMEWPLAA